MIIFAEEHNTYHSSLFHFDDLEEMTNLLWYTSQEYIEMRASGMETVVAFMENDDGRTLLGDDENNENDSETFRGLEYRTHTGAWTRYDNIRIAYNSVLNEQDRQWDNDHKDDDTLSRVYIEHSIPCTIDAIHRAVIDSQIAKEICIEMIEQIEKEIRHEIYKYLLRQSVLVKKSSTSSCYCSSITEYQNHQHHHLLYWRTALISIYNMFVV